MNYADEIEEAAEAVRPFMVTKGRVRAASEEFPIETMVSATALAQQARPTLQFERLAIVERFTEPIAIAEIAAVLELPLRAIQVVVSEMISEGLLKGHTTVSAVDSSVLLRIRSAVAAL